MIAHYKHGTDERIPYPLRVEYRSEKEYVLLNRFEYHAKCGKTIGEYMGYCYDFGTVPAISEFFVSRMDFGYAYTIHDIGCDRHTWDDGTEMTQKQVDDLFLEVALWVEESKWRRFKARVAWLAIRAHSLTVKKFRS